MFSKGLKHIPHRKLNPKHAFLAIWEGWEKNPKILDFQTHQDHKIVLHNKFYNWFSSKFPTYFTHLNNTANEHLINEKIQWLLHRLYFTGLDRAGKTSIALCKCLIRNKAFERFQGNEFIDHYFSTIQYDNTISTFSFIPPYNKFKEIPFLMATYKIQKNSFRWLTNAHNCVF